MVLPNQLDQYLAQEQLQIHQTQVLLLVRVVMVHLLHLVALFRMGQVLEQL